MEPPRCTVPFLEGLALAQPLAASSAAPGSLPLLLEFTIWWADLQSGTLAGQLPPSTLPCEPLSPPETQVSVPGQE